MTRPAAAPAVNPEAIEIPFHRVATFVRQLSHDVRNHLGSMDLQAAFISELVTDPEASSELLKLRAMIMGAARSIQAVSANFWISQPACFGLSGRLLISEFRERVGRLFPEDAGRIEWDVELAAEPVSVDLEMMIAALSEFVRNALYFHEGEEAIRARVTAADGWLIFELSEKRVSLDGVPEHWGLTPLVTTRRGGYGLGLFHARQMLTAHGAEVQFFHDPARGILTARVSVPLVEE